MIQTGKKVIRILFEREDVQGSIIRNQGNILDLGKKETGGYLIRVINGTRLHFLPARFTYEVNVDSKFNLIYFSIVSFEY